MGRPRTPTAVLDMTGAFREHPERKADRAGEPTGLPGVGDPPKHLTPREADIWNELAGYCAKGVLTVMDRPLLEQVCQLMARSRDRRKKMNGTERGMLVKCLSLMGMTPSDRSRLNIHPKTPKGDDGWGKA